MGLWPRKSAEPVIVTEAAQARAAAALALDAGLRDHALAPFRAAAAGRAGLPGTLLEIHAAQPAESAAADGPWARAPQRFELQSNVGDLIGESDGSGVTIRLPDLDGHSGDVIVTAPQNQVQALMTHAAAHPVGLAMVLLLAQVKPEAQPGFLGWFWHALAGAKQTDAMYAVRTDDDLIYAMRLGPRGADLYAYANGQAAQEPMAGLTRRQLDRAMMEHGFATDGDPETTRRTE